MNMTNQVARTACPIAERSGVTREIFLREIQPMNTPVVLRGLVAGWPIVSSAAMGVEEISRKVSLHSLEKSISMFEADVSTGGRFFYSSDLTGFNFHRRQTSIRGLFDRLAHNSAGPRSYFYAGAINIPDHLPTIRAELPMPLLQHKEEVLMSAWIGTSSRIPLHWDLPDNIACVAAGRRAFTLFPIDQLPNLYIGPLDRTIAGQPCSLVDFHDVDEVRFPKFSDALPYGQYTELNPGDAIYIPSMWLHHVESLDSFGMLINFWWREGPPHLITPMATMMHALLSLRGMPTRERHAWRIMFDHYLFGDQEEALAHIPLHARGLWGELSPRETAVLRQMIGQRLGG